MKVTDAIADIISRLGIAQVFCVTGGGAMHLNDSFANHPMLRIIFNHHEQACAVAAEGYYRASGKVACVNVTTGPGGLNALTGVLGQWTDSIPAIYVSGQVKFETTIGSCPDIALRQLGDQEVDIVSVVRPIVKYAVQVRDPSRIRFELEKAYHIATSGRMGPVWLDIPMNIQGAVVDESALEGYIPSKDPPVGINASLEKGVKAIVSAKRPLVVLGHGIRLAGALKEMEEFITHLGAPVVTTFNGFDLVAEDHPLFVGRIGTLGSRSGNFALQNADVVLIVGSRNNIRQASYDWGNFAHRAQRIIVDIDEAELRKPTVKPTLPIVMDAKPFLATALHMLEGVMGGKDHAEWLAWCKERKIRYPVVQEFQTDDSAGLSPYYFFRAVSRSLPAGSVSVAGNGNCLRLSFPGGRSQCRR